MAETLVIELREREGSSERPQLPAQTDRPAPTVLPPAQGGRDATATAATEELARRQQRDEELSRKREALKQSALSSFASNTAGQMNAQQQALRESMAVMLRQELAAVFAAGSQTPSGNVAGGTSAVAAGTGAASAGSPAGGAAAGAAAGSAGGAVGAAVGAIVGALDAAKGMATEAIRKSVENIGEGFRAAAALDARRLHAQFEGVVEALPLFGRALSEASRQVRGFFEALNTTAARLKLFEGQLAGASAQADVAQILGDIRRAQLLGPDLARFIEAQSRASQAAQDAMATILKRMLPYVVAIAETGAEMLERVSRAIAKYLGEAGGGPADINLFREILEASRILPRRRDDFPAPPVGLRRPLGG